MDQARRGRRYKLVLVAICLAALAVGVSACGGSGGSSSTSSSTTGGEGSSEDVSPGNEALTVSVVMGFGGPYGEIIEQAYDGFKAAVADVNEEGGVNGREIKLAKIDHHETSAGGVAACKEIQSNGSIVAAVLQGATGANTSAVNCLDQAGIPTVYLSSGKEEDLEYAFTYLPTGEEEAAATSSYIKNALELGSTKVGVIYDGGEAYVDMKNAFEAAAESEGLEVVSSEEVSESQSSFVPQLTQMKEAGVETVAIFATGEATGIWRDAATIGFKPHFSGTGYVFNFVTEGAKDSATGATGIGDNAMVDTPAYAGYEKSMKAHGWDVPRTEDDGFVLFGAGELVIEMLKKAGEDPTAESFVSGAETIKDYENGILPPITYSKDDHFGATASFPAICCNSDFTWKSAGPPQSKY